MPSSAMASTTAGLIVVGGRGAGGAHDDPVAGVVGEEGGGHLGAAGVVDADEQDFGAGRSVIVGVSGWGWG